MLGVGARIGSLYGLEDWASLAAFLLLFQLIMFLASPVVNGVIRMETRRGCVWAGSDSRIVPNSEEVAAHAFRFWRRSGSSRSESAGVHQIWLYSHHGCGAPGFCIQLRSLVERQVAQVRENTRKLRL